MDELERQIKKLIAPRSSQTLASSWVGHIPSITPAGEKPTMKVEDVVGFGEIAIQLKEQYVEDVDRDLNLKGKPTTQFALVKGVRSFVFWEGLYLLHKASHVMSCAEVGVKRGVKTWSLCEAYQSALFGAKAICHLLGIAFPEHDSKTVMVDVWPDDPNKQKKSKTPVILEAEPTIQFTRWPFLFQHQHIWRVFQRLLRISSILTWPIEYKKALADLDHSKFAYQRNQIQYTNREWIFNDLHTPDIDATFGEHPTDLSDALKHRIESDFSIALGLAILRLGYLLVDQITQNTNILNDEKDLIRSQFTSDKHPLYLSAHP
jgi:hypothetical protein